MKLNDKGQCCGKRPLKYKRPYPHYFCSKCNREFDIDGQQKENWAWRCNGDEWAKKRPENTPASPYMLYCERMATMLSTLLIPVRQLSCEDGIPSQQMLITTTNLADALLAEYEAFVAQQCGRRGVKEYNDHGA